MNVNKHPNKKHLIARGLSFGGFLIKLGIRIVTESAYRSRYCTYLMLDVFLFRFYNSSAVFFTLYFPYLL